MKEVLAENLFGKKKIFDPRDIAREQFGGKEPILIPKGVYFDCNVFDAINGIAVREDSPKGEMLRELGGFLSIEDLLPNVVANEPLYENIFRLEKPKLVVDNQKSINNENKVKSKPILRVVYSDESREIDENKFPQETFGVGYNNPVEEPSSIFRPINYPTQGNSFGQRWSSSSWYHGINVPLEHRLNDRSGYNMFPMQTGYRGYIPRCSRYSIR